MTTVPTWAWQLVVLVGGLLSAAVLLALARPRGSWGSRLRARFVMGLPLGTLLSVAFVLAVYLFVQNGLANWYSPTQIPYRAWSYFYPLGMAVAPFAHGGPGHLAGNLVGTVTFGVLAEYAWGHFPTGRGEQSFSSLRTNPFARALAFFGGVVAVGLLTSLFALGPVIGFSGVVFAFVGFALVRYPLATAVLVLGADVVGLVYRALLSPETTAVARSRFVTPWFADVAIQGHYLGFLLGAVLGLVLVRQRGVRPSAGYLWFAVLVFGADQTLWALYIPESGSQFVLLRALGVAVVFLLAALVTASARTGERSLVGAIDLSRGEAARGLLVAVLVAVAVVAVPINLLTVGTATVGAENPVQVRDYTVYYAEDVPHQLTSAVNVSVGGLSSQVNVSGVIVTSEARNIWWPEVTAARLSSQGRGTVHLGGPGWRRSVTATRPGWRLLGGEAAYKVFLRAENRSRQRAFGSEPATAEGTFAGRNVSVAPAEDGFDVLVSRNNETLGRAPIPENGTVTVDRVRFHRNATRLFAVVDDTRIRVATRLEY
jgi:membrane associated rhomboid family serine protease